jgi:DNA-binding SARP family transcriptional activator
MLDIRLFGATTVATPQGVVGAAELGGVKPRQILEILAVSAGVQVPKELLADMLWDGRPPQSWVGTLESYVCVLRRSLGAARGRDSVLRTVKHGYLLDVRAVRTDLHEFRSRVRQADGLEPGPALGRLEEALSLVRGELLAGEVYATWAIRERAAFQGEVLAVASRAARLALELGELGVATRMARRAVASDAIAEEAWRLLMRSLWASGRRSEALRAYFELRDTLASELGTDPAVESQALYLEILRDGDAGVQVRPDGRDEVRVLMRLLRQAVASIPGVEEPRTDRALAEIAASLAGVA